MGESLVSCSFCTVCDLLGVAGGVFNLLLGLAFAAAVLFVVLSGMLRIYAGGNKYRIIQAKSGLRYSVVGFCIVFVGWVFIHSFFQVIGYKNSNWWQINCDVSSEPLSKGVDGSKTYSDLSSIVPAGDINDLVGRDLGIEAIDLTTIDVENMKQDLNLLKPGEKMVFLTTGADLKDTDLESYVNGLAGYPVGSDEQFKQLDKKFQEAASFNMLDGGAAVFGEGEYTDLTTDPIEQNFSGSFDKLISRMKEKGAKKIIVMKSGNSLDNLEKCVDSGGDWVDFKNKCSSQKQICGQENLKCTSVSSPYADCQCRPGYCLRNGKCEKSDSVSTTGIKPKGEEDEDKDGVPNKSDRCLGTPKGETINKDATSDSYGCSCSQLTLSDRSCPSNRCEGSYLVTYPQSGKDKCSGGKVTVYSCNSLSSAYDATCAQTQSTSNFIDKTNQIQQNSNLYNQLKDWLNQGKNNQGSTGSGSSSGNTGGSGTGNTGGTGTGQTGTGQTGTGQPGNTDTGGNTQTDTGGGTYTPSEDLGKNGDFNRLAECMGFKKGEIPKNGALIGFYTDRSHTRMNMWYLDPRTGKAIGSNGDTTGQQPLIAYPQGIGNKYGIGESGIYAIQVQPHYSDSGDTVESPLTARSDVKMTTSGANPKDNPRINLHPGTATAGCLGLGNRAQSDGFMNATWTTVRGSAKPADYNDDLSQKKGSAYDKHRARDTVIFATMDAGQCLKEGSVDNAINTLQSHKGYGGYDPQMINYTVQQS